jgi:glycerol dehydrogenase
MISSIIFPGRYIQGYDAIKRLGPEIARLGKTGYFICSPTVYGKLLPASRGEIEKHCRIVAEKFGGECCDDEINRIVELAGGNDGMVIIGMGGGKVIDTAKAVANKLSMPLIIAPTVASSDAPCSSVSVLYTPEGAHDRPVSHPRNPDVVLVDTRIIAAAPVRFLVAGMGDALATWFEAESCRNNYAENLTDTGGVGTMTAYSLAHLCYQILCEYGLSAKKACEAHVVTPALEHVIEANTLLSGVGFESGGLAAAHGIQMGFTVLKETQGYLHGEEVAFGTLASLFLTDKDKDIMDEVYYFCEAVGLPTTLADIGLPEISEAQLRQIAEFVLLDDNPIHNEAVPITEESVIASVLAADYEGRLRKQ